MFEEDVAGVTGGLPIVTQLTVKGAAIAAVSIGAVVLFRVLLLIVAVALGVN